MIISQKMSLNVSDTKLIFYVNLKTNLHFFRKNQINNKQYDLARSAPISIMEVVIT